MKDKPQAMPDRTFRDRMTIGQGAERVELYFFGPAHTGGDAFVVFPTQRVMSAGDVYPWKAAPVVDDANGGSAVALPDTLEQVIRTVKGVDTVIPGHMALATWADFVEFGEFNRQLLTAARAGKAAGRTVDQALAGLKLPPRFDAYLANQPLKGLEFLGTARERARINIELVYKAED